MTSFFILVVCGLMFLGGGFVLFAEGMADTAGDDKIAGCAFIVAAVGLIGFIVKAIMLIVGLF